MVAVKLYLALLCVLCGFSASRSSTVTFDNGEEEEENIDTIRIKAQFHLEELQKSLHRISSIDKTLDLLRRQKRDTDPDFPSNSNTNTLYPKLNELFTSLYGLCGRFKDLHGTFENQGPPAASVTGKPDGVTDNVTESVIEKVTDSDTQTVTENDKDKVAKSDDKEKVTEESDKEKVKKRNKEKPIEIVTDSVGEASSLNCQELRQNADMKHQPDILPVRVKATRTGDKVAVTFDICQNGKGKVTTFAGFEFNRFSLPLPQDDTDNNNNNNNNNNNETTQVNLNIDTSNKCEERYEIDSQVMFEDSPVPARSFVEMKVDVCRYDKFQNESLSWDERRWERKEGTVTQDISLPNIDFISGFEEEMSLGKGQNRTVDMVIVMDDDTSMYVSGLFYVKDKDNMVHNYYEVRLNNNVKSGEVGSLGNARLRVIYVEVLNSTVLPRNAATKGCGNGYGGDDGKPKIKVTVRLTIMAGRKKRTGKVEIVATTRLGSYYDRQIVRYLSYNRIIRIKWGNKRQIFPSKSFYFTEMRPSLCTKEGNQNYEAYDKNCTLMCMAAGRSFYGMAITKNGNPVTIYRSLTTQLHDTIFTMVDLGAATSTINGTYSCTATARNGYAESRQLVLVSDGFPVINKTSVDLSKDGKTATVACVVHGTVPMSVSIQTTSNDNRRERIGDKTTSIRGELRTKTAITLTVTVPMDDLRYPTTVVGCYVSKSIVNPSKTLSLEGLIPNYKPTSLSPNSPEHHR